MQKIKRLIEYDLPYWTVPLALLGLTIITFGLLLPQWGFYWDDWAKILVSRVWGLSGYWGYYAEDRPISAWTHILFTPLLGENPFNWQVFVLALRWLAACSLWWCLNGIFPRAKFSSALAAVLFLLYPAFTQQPIAVTYHQQWLQYVLYFMSLIAMIQAVRRPGRWSLFTVLGLSVGLLQFSITEYFLVLEGLRPFVLWFLSGELEEKYTFRQRVIFVLKQWLPYLVLWGSFVVWRVFFMPQTGADPYRPQMIFRLISQPVSTSFALLKIIFVDSFYVLVTSWAKPLDIGLTTVIPPFVSFSWYIGLGAAVLLGVYLALLGAKKEVMPGQERWMLGMIVLGMAAIVLGCMPGWAIDRRVIDDFHSNRYAMPGMFGAAMIWTAVVEWLSPRRLQKVVLVTAAAALLIVFQLQTGNEYSRVWEQQRDFYWQLAWRAPSLQPNTAVLSEEELFSNQGGFSISAALNALYPQPAGGKTLAYWFYGLIPRFVDSSNHPLDIPLKTAFRTEFFVGKTPQSILVYFDPQRANCLWVLGEKDKNDPDLSPLTVKFLPASNLERISAYPTPGYPPQDMFGMEPGHGWCYFYQKAALAGQAADWQEVAALGDKVRQGQKLEPSDAEFKTPHEWLVFIEGYARADRWQDAGQLTTAAANINIKKYRASMCDFWKSLADSTPDNPQKTDAGQEVSSALKCTW